MAEMSAMSRSAVQTETAPEQQLQQWAQDAARLVDAEVQEVVFAVIRETVPR